MKKSEKARAQRERIREFDKELFSYTGQVAWFLPGIWSFLLLILMAIPIQEIGNDNGIWLAGMVFAIWISYGILRPYTNTTDALTPQQVKNRTYDKLKYLPVSKMQYNIVRIKYLFDYVWKLSAIGMILQCVSAAFCIKRVELGNVLYVIGILFVLPLAAGWLQLWIDE